MGSDRTAQRLSRILAMIPWIIEHEGADVDELITRFDYKDRPDLVSDLHLVFMTGLPGYGPGDLIDVDLYDDEVYIGEADHFSRPLRLNAAEALGLLAAGMTFIESDQAPPALVSAVEKLTNAVVPDAESLVALDVPTPDIVPALKDAVEAGRVIRIAYVALSTNDRTERDVEGESVFFNLGNWYLSGFCRLKNADRVFRVDRIAEVVVLDETYEPRDRGIEPMVQYRPDDDDVHVSFTTDPTSRWVAEYYPVDALDLEDGSQRITMSVSDPLVAARLLLRLGTAASDVEGSEVEGAIRDLRTRIRAQYERTK